MKIPGILVVVAVENLLMFNRKTGDASASFGTPSVFPLRNAVVLTHRSHLNELSVYRKQEPITGAGGGCREDLRILKRFQGFLTIIACHATRHTTWSLRSSFRAWSGRN